MAVHLQKFIIKLRLRLMFVSVNQPTNQPCREAVNNLYMGNTMYVATFETILVENCKIFILTCI